MFSFFSGGQIRKMWSGHQNHHFGKLPGVPQGGGFSPPICRAKISWINLQPLKRAKNVASGSLLGKNPTGLLARRAKNSHKNNNDLLYPLPLRIICKLVLIVDAISDCDEVVFSDFCMRGSCSLLPFLSGAPKKLYAGNMTNERIVMQYDSKMCVDYKFWILE